MTSLINYALEANLGLIVLYGVYLFVFRNEYDFGKQRAFLLGATAISLVAPLLQLAPASVPMIFGAPTGVTILPEVIVGPSGAASASSITAAQIAGWVYVAVMLLLMVPVIINIWKTLHVLRRSVSRKSGDYLLIESDENSASWSFFRVIYVGRAGQLSGDEKELIIRHEVEHGRLMHSIDIILISAICIVFWFNPVVWMLRRTLMRVHEYQVDHSISRTTNPSDYCILLAKTALQSHGFVLSNPFNQSFILKRINMIQQIKHRVSNWKVSALIVSLCIYIVAVACTEQVSETNASAGATPKEVQAAADRLTSLYPSSKFTIQETSQAEIKDVKDLHFMYVAGDKIWVVVRTAGAPATVMTVVDHSAEPALGIQKFYEMIGEAMVYPEESAKKGVEGKVFIEFVVEPDGNLSNYKVVRGVDPALDVEALRVTMLVGSMAKWAPGVQSGKAVAQKLVLPINFKLED